MNKDWKEKYLPKIERLIGEEIPPEILRALKVEGRIKFIPKPTSKLGSAVSTSAEEPQPNAAKRQRDEVDDLIDEVVATEDMVKTLEDMYDDLTKDMRIPPPSDTVGAAAQQLGSPDGAITKDILDRAEAIIEHFPYTTGMGNPVVGALTGDSTLTGEYIRCNNITKAMADAYEAGLDNEETLENIINNFRNPAEQAEDDFKKKLGNMVGYIFNMLWWDKIWVRLADFFLVQTERVFAKPIDTPILLFRFKRLKKSNYYRFGFIHKLLNELRIILLCRIPASAWSDYQPDPKFQFYNQDTNNFMKLKDYCSQQFGQNCPEGTVLVKEESEGEDDNFKLKVKDETLSEDTAEQLRNAFPDSNCIHESFFRSAFAEEKTDGPFISPTCLEAAKTVMDAVERDALHFGDPDNVAESTGEIAARASAGNIGGLRGI